MDDLRQLFFGDGGGRKEQSFLYVGFIEVRIVSQDLRVFHSSGNHTKHCRHWNPQPANTRNSPHLVRIYSNSREVHTGGSNP